MDKSLTSEMEGSFQPRNLLFKGYKKIRLIQENMAKYLRYDDKI